MTGDLDAYWRKRDFDRTPEPRGARPADAPGATFVVQRHAASRLHFDFRLEHGGVLKSWALPKEPSLDPSIRRLAVPTEDHPLEYAEFEGEIPAPGYGAGSVVIWDRGTWRPIGDAASGLEIGKLTFELQGRRLRGRWTLVRTSRAQPGGGKVNWLLQKRAERDAAAADDDARAGLRHVRELDGAEPAELPHEVEPQLATLTEIAPTGDGWLHEPKLDGYRLLVRLDRGEVELSTRAGHDWTDRLPTIAAAIRRLPCTTAYLDGEAVVFDASGRTDFQALQRALGADESAIAYVAFDLLHLDGFDLRGAPLWIRKNLLRALFESAPPPLRFSEHTERSGSAFYRAACELGLEGTIAKRRDDPYRAGRSRSWRKLKCHRRQEFVIVGFTEPAGTRSGFGALLLGAREKPGAPLAFAGKVGTGFDAGTLHRLRARLDRLLRDDPPIVERTVRGLRSAVRWVEPVLVAEVKFSEWTDGGRLRHPVFLGLREDKSGGDVVRERAQDVPSAGSKRPTETLAACARAPQTRQKPAAPVELTHPDKVLFGHGLPDAAMVTKRDLAEYWDAIADLALPYLGGRPLTLLRCPDGIGEACFYQKHIGAAVPAAVGRVSIAAGEDPYAMVDDAQGLRGLVQIGALELHVRGARSHDLERPDILVFDLDPDEGLPWREVALAADELRDRLRRLGLEAFARVTGGKGLHLVVPVEPGPDWPAVKRFTRTVVERMVHDAPQRFTATPQKIARAGRIFLDYLRNDRHATAIGAYSPRARPGAPVALPIAWSELDVQADAPPRFPLQHAKALVRERAQDPWADFERARRSLLA